MRNKDKLETLRQAKTLIGVCRMFFKYDANYFYYVPVEFNEKFFYGIEEDDFITNGFCIRKISDLKKVEIKDDKCVEFLKNEKTFDNICPPEVCLDNWKTIFESLQKSEKFVIVQKEDLDEKESSFTIGRISKINNASLRMQDFDADGVWSKTDIRFRDITSVTFKSRYVSVWEKYLD